MNRFLNMRSSEHDEVYKDLVFFFVVFCNTTNHWKQYLIIIRIISSKLKKSNYLHLLQDLLKHKKHSQSVFIIVFLVFIIQ